MANTDTLRLMQPSQDYRTLPPVLDDHRITGKKHGHGFWHTIPI